MKKNQNGLSITRPDKQMSKCRIYLKHLVTDVFHINHLNKKWKALKK